MANTSLDKNVLFYGAGTMSRAHLKPDVKLMFMAARRRVITGFFLPKTMFSASFTVIQIT